uniref:AlNc14C538G12095 protein n=1 Tax=Albugo laibachii Nc14 TaxID=890382 RepID=F0X108_9STRA|nr:AlNc14C538G12095 [Albugo laibachii Nc14]|eukprot:CCA27455.1 AlNc14C538G12095 [Albugo laibachii Nc14]
MSQIDDQFEGRELNHNQFVRASMFELANIKVESEEAGRIESDSMCALGTTSDSRGDAGIKPDEEPRGQKSGRPNAGRLAADDPHLARAVTELSKPERKTREAQQQLLEVKQQESYTEAFVHKLALEVAQRPWTCSLVRWGLFESRKGVGEEVNTNWYKILCHTRGGIHRPQGNVQNLQGRMRCGEEDLNEDIWRIYFLQAKECDTTRVAALTNTSQNLKMSTRYYAHSRVDHLMQEFVEMLDKMNMEGFDEQEPNLCIKLLIKAIRLAVFRQSIHTELQTQRTKFIEKAYRNTLHGSNRKLKLS